MPLRVGEIYYSVTKLNCIKIKVETGKSALGNFVLRSVTADNKNAADVVEKYDAAFVSGQYGDAFVLAQKALTRGASAIILNSATCSAHTHEMIADLCVQYNVPLVEIEEYGDFAVALDLFKNEIDVYEKKRVKMNCELKNMLIFHDKPGCCLSVADKYNGSSNINYCVSVLKFVCKDDSASGEQLLYQAEKFVEISVNEIAEDSPVICIGTRMVLIFGGKAENTVKAATEAAVKTIQPELAKKFDVYIGTGRCFKGVENLYESFVTASKAAGIQAVRKCANSVLSYENLGISKLLMEIDYNSSPARDFLCETMKPLVEYDKRNGTNLVDFLSMYFEYSGQIKKIGEQLYMHRNSVNYKINRIGEIVGRNLSDVSDRSEMFVALRLFELSSGGDFL